jgi:hypothetical protein
MALARIISHSQLCSRELALDLLARGYVVQIVSPDAIPDDLADLELRVDSTPENVLTATVASHDGGRKASFDFVHHLKTPTVDFKRKPPQMDEAAFVPLDPITLDPITLKVKRDPAELKLVGPKNVLEEGKPARIAAYEPSLEPGPGPTEQDIAPTSPEAFKPITSSDLPPTLDNVPSPEIADASATPRGESGSTLDGPTLFGSTLPEDGDAGAMRDVPRVAQPVEPVPATGARTVLKPGRAVFDWGKRFASGVQFPQWVWRAGVASVALLFVAFALSAGLRPRTGVSSPAAAASSYFKDSTIAQDKSANVGSQKPAPAVAASSSLPGKDAVSASVTPGAEHAPLRAISNSKQLTRIGPKTSSHHSVVSHHGEDIVAPNTITYLDQPNAKPIPVTQAAHHRARSSKSASPVAANTVTYLNGKTSKTGSDK